MWIESSRPDPISNISFDYLLFCNSRFSTLILVRTELFFRFHIFLWIYIHFEYNLAYWMKIIVFCIFFSVLRVNLPFSHREYPIGTLCYIKPKLIKSSRPVINKSPIELNCCIWNMSQAEKRNDIELKWNVKKMRKNYIMSLFDQHSANNG